MATQPSGEEIEISIPYFLPLDHVILEKGDTVNYIYLRRNGLCTLSREKKKKKTAKLNFDEGSSLNEMTHLARKNKCSPICDYYDPSH